LFSRKDLAAIFAWALLKLKILLFGLLSSWNYRHMPPELASTFESRVVLCLVLHKKTLGRGLLYEFEARMHNALSSALFSWDACSNEAEYNLYSILNTFL
jgi:hypothetical protein